MTLFKEVSDKYGLSNISATHFYAVDINHDGYTDIAYLENFYSVPKFLVFDKKKKMFESLESPFTEGVRASYLYFVDINRDGLIDVFLGTLNQKTELTKYPLKLYIGNKSKNGFMFVEQRDAFPPNKEPTSSISLVDFNNDGILDVYAANWYYYNRRTLNYETVPDRLYQGLKDLKFQDVSYLLEDEHKYHSETARYPNARPTYAVSSCDIDQDGYVDILTANSGGYKNKLWMNRASLKGGRIFKDYGESSGYSADIVGRLDPKGGGNTYFANCADYNHDKIIDIIMGELTHARSLENVDVSSVLTGSSPNFPPKFIRSPYFDDQGKPNWSQGDKRATWADLNFDGFTDLLIDNSGFPPDSRLILFLQEKDHSFINLAKEAGIDHLNPSGSILLDVNQDGKLDILSGQTNVRNSTIVKKVFLYLNELPYEGNRVIRVYLRNQYHGLGGVGARVELKGRKYSQVKWNETVRGGLPSQNEEGLHFGISICLLYTSPSPRDV